MFMHVGTFYIYATAICCNAQYKLIVNKYKTDVGLFKCMGHDLQRFANKTGMLALTIHIGL